MGHAKLTSRTDNDLPAFIINKRVAQPSDALAPLLVNMSEPGADQALREMVSKNDIFEVVDEYAELYAELLLSKNAQLYRANLAVQKASVREEIEKHYDGKPAWKLGTWVYYPWSGRLVHVLSQDLFEELRTIRNKELVTKAEQQKLHEFNVACLGMSVGSASALAIAISGISNKIKLVDGAVISGSNLNRILTGVHNVGNRKEVVLSRLIYEMNPYAQVLPLGKADKSNLTDVFDNPWPTQIIVDEIDDLEMKIHLRIEARARRIPVIMATELADSIMLDIERYDLEPKRPLFHNLIKNIEKTVEEPTTNHRVWMKKAVEIIGPKNMPLRMQKSLLKIGSTVVTHPQLGSTVMSTGGVVAFAIKKIALGEDMPSQRTTIDFQKTFQPFYRKRKQKRAKKKHTKVIRKAVSNF